VSRLPPDIFEPLTRARRGDPETSLEAAEGIAPRMNALRQVVLNHFAVRGDMTDLQLQILCANHGATFRTRRAELVQMGLIRDSGRRTVQLKRNRIIWTLTQLGREAAKP